MWHLGTWGSSGGAARLNGLRDFPTKTILWFHQSFTQYEESFVTWKDIREKPSKELSGLFSPCLSDENDSRNPRIVAFLAQFLAEGAQDSWVQTVALRDLSWAVSPTQCCSGGHSLDSVLLEVHSSLSQCGILWNIMSRSELPDVGTVAKFSFPAS